MAPIVYTKDGSDAAHEPTALTVTLTTAGWVADEQDVAASGVTASSIVIVAPDPSDQAAYVAAGIICTGQGVDSLTFTATDTPVADLDVKVVIL